MAALATIPVAYLAAASMAIGTAGAVMQYKVGQQQASDQAAANAKTAENALTARNYQTQQLQTRAIQERDAASEKIFDTRIQALEGSASAENIALARGVQGNTVDALAREYWAKEGRGETAISKTANNTIQQLAAEQNGTQAQYENRLNSSPLVREPSLAALGLGIGTAVANNAALAVRGAAKSPVKKEE